MTNIEQQQALDIESKYLGDIRKQFIRPTPDQQIRVKVSISELLGNVSLAFWRGHDYAKEKFIAGSKATESAGVQWVKASDHLPEDCWQGKFRLITDDSLKEYIGMFQLQNEYVPSNRFIVGARTFNPRNVEYYSESPSRSLLQQENEQEELKSEPVVVEKFADNGAHSHWELVNRDTGEIIWTEEALNQKP